MKLKVKKISTDAKLPSYAHAGDSGMDLYSTEDAVLQPGDIKVVGTGLAVSMPKGFEAQIRPKTGLTSKFGLTVLNTPGTIDSCYRGELKVILINLGKEPYRVEKGKKIAQMVISRVEEAQIETVEELDETTRNAGGFGSTGFG